MRCATSARTGWPARAAHLLRVLVVVALALGGAAARGPAPVVVLGLQGAVDPASADYLVRGIRRGGELRAPLVVIEVDTPGGLESSMRQVVQAILDAPVPVAVYVTPGGARAASAGTYLVYAAHVAAMAPATTLGAATPVALGWSGGAPAPKPGARDGAAATGAAPPASGPVAADAMTAKQVHDAAAFIRGLAQLRGRNADWGERAVREAVSLTAGEALQARVIDLLADDLPSLLAQADGRTVQVAGGARRLATRGAALELRPPDWRHRLLSAIAHPSVALILMMLGVWGLFFEFAAPGHGVSGVTGAICLLLGLFALQLLPVNYAALALLVLGIGLLVAELFVPSFGVLGVGGIAALAAGGILLIDPELPGGGVPVPLVLALALLSAAAVLAGGGVALRTRRQPVVSGREHLVGASGRVLQSEAGETWADVLGERWQVVAAQPLAPGQRVRVEAVHGLTLQVRPDASPAANGGSMR